MRTLQQAGGAYSCVTAPKDHDVRVWLRGFQEGDNLRLLRVKEEKISSVVTEDGSLPPLPVARYPGYALNMTWDVPVEKAMGILKVTVCWHDIAFRNEWGFTENTFLY